MTAVRLWEGGRVMDRHGQRELKGREANRECLKPEAFKSKEH